MEPGVPGTPGRVWALDPDGPQHYFYAFDILADEEGAAVQDCNAFERLDALQRVQERFELRDEEGRRPVSVRTKTWVSLREDDFSTNNMGEARPAFFELMASRVLNRIVSEYDTDGWVFTPILVPYTFAPPAPGARNRCARPVAAGLPFSAFPKTFKYKPRERMTVDLFFVGAAPLALEAGAERGVRASALELRRARIVAVAGAPTLDPGLIYEFALDGDGPPASGGGARAETGQEHELRFDPDGKARLVLRPVRPRPEKPAPNSLRTVDAVVKLWLEPISRAALTGHSAELLFKYHNRVKRRLYEAALVTVGRWLRGKPRLLDVGAGRGGDVGKWAQRRPDGEGLESAFSHVTAVEPYPPYAAELRRRAAATGWLREGENFTVVEEGFLAAPLPEGTFDVVSAMFSLTYFAREGLAPFAEKLRRLASPEGCAFVFASLDGDQIDHLFAQPPAWGAGHLQGAGLSLDGSFGPGDTWLRNLGAGEVEIHIPASTANPEGKPRREGKLRVSELIRVLAPASHFTRVACEERLLGTFEALLGTCYAYGLAELGREGPQLLAGPDLVAEGQPRLSARALPKVEAPPETLPAGPAGPAGPRPSPEARDLPELAGLRLRGESRVLPRPKPRVGAVAPTLAALPPLVPLLLELGESRGEQRREVPIEEGEVLLACSLSAEGGCRPCPPGLVRVGAAPGPDCLIHALLAAANAPYQAARSAETRARLALELRELLGRFLRLRFAAPPFAAFDWVARGDLRRQAEAFAAELLAAFAVPSMLADRQQRELWNPFRGFPTANPMQDLIAAMQAEGRERLAHPARDFARFTADLQRLSAAPAPAPASAPEKPPLPSPAFASLTGYTGGVPSLLQFYGVPANYENLLAAVSRARNFSESGVLALIEARLPLPLYLLAPICQLLALNALVVTEEAGTFRLEERVEPFPGMPGVPFVVLLHRGECFEPLGLREVSSGLVVTLFLRRLPELLLLLRI